MNDDRAQLAALEVRLAKERSARAVADALVPAYLPSDSTAWMQTYTGRAFYPLNPQPAHVDLEDIAHGLANLCRYGGQCRTFYCVTPETRVLTSALTWVEAGNLDIGDELIGFDENPIHTSPTSRARRKIRPATVMHDGIITRPCYKVTLSDGTTLRSSADHPWLISAKASRNQSWRTTEELFHDIKLGRKRMMIRFFRPWSSVHTYNAGWLAGIFDGEGYISGRAGGLEVAVAQKPGVVLDQITHLLRLHNIHFRDSYILPSGVAQLHLNGQWNDRLAFLGMYRPLRLIRNFQDRLRSGDCHPTFGGNGGNEFLQITNVEPIGDQEVVALETSTHTYFAEGFGAHNSVAEHSVLLSYAVPPELARWALMHDASEAYLSDVIRPIKPYLRGYYDIEERVLESIAVRFDLPWPAPLALKPYDDRILLNEQARLMAPPPMPWNVPGEPLPGISVTGWLPMQAKVRFLTRAAELGLR